MSDQKLSNVTRLGYGITDFGLNLFYAYLNFFLLLYYTDVLLIPPAIAGLIFAIGVVWDGLTDPPMGLIASRTHTKMGSYRPYLLVGAPMLAGSFVLMFAAPLLFPSMLVLACLVTHLLFRACFTIVAIPHAAMSANMTQDSKERSTLAGVRMVFAPLGGLFTAILTWDLAKTFGGEDLVFGFFGVSIVYATLGLLIFWVTFALTRERTVSQASVPKSPKQISRFLFGNTALLILLAAIIINSIGQAIFSSALAHYVIYVAVAPIDLPIALFTILVSVTLGVPVWAYLSRHISKRNCWIYGALIATGAQVVIYFAMPDTVAAFIGLLALVGFGTSAYIVMMWAMLPDTVEYGEWKSGFRDEGIVFGINQLSIKASNGLGIALLGFALAAAGFIANTGQSPETIAMLNATTLLVPALCSILAIVIISFYPIDSSLHQKLVEETASKNRKLQERGIG